jgi:hypothetical protein
MFGVTEIIITLYFQHFLYHSTHHLFDFVLPLVGGTTGVVELYYVFYIVFFYEFLNGYSIIPVQHISSFINSASGGATTNSQMSFILSQGGNLHK